MPLQTSGTITLAQIQTEFGGSNPIGLNEYYRGGGLVPNTPVNANIPTSGQIALSNFYGGSKSVTTIYDTSQATNTTRSTTTVYETFYFTTFKDGKQSISEETSRSTSRSTTTAYNTTTSFQTSRNT